MPVAAVIEEKIFCVNGGLSPDLHSLEQIRRIVRPTDVGDIRRSPENLNIIGRGNQLQTDTPSWTPL